MAKSGGRPKKNPAHATPDPGRKGKAPAEGGSISGYFRTIFAENPKLLKSRSNDELLRRWLADHPGEKEVPKKVRQNLANIKSVLRSHKRKRRQAEVSAGAVARPAAPHAPRKDLGTLEVRIDECLMMARSMDPEGLDDVIQCLRRARNGVVWKLGE